MALVYGVVCVAMAFMAKNLGGILQASLTIFGAVGGPLLAVFTLGMFTTVGNQTVIQDSHSLNSFMNIFFFYFKGSFSWSGLWFGIHFLDKFRGTKTSIADFARIYFWM